MTETDHGVCRHCGSAIYFEADDWYHGPESLDRDPDVSDWRFCDIGTDEGSIAEPEDDEAPDVWAMLEEPAPAGCEAVQDLYSWSLNYDAGRGPFTLFLDLIGWSEDVIGEPLYNLSSASLGYYELGKLGLALREYADRPHDVREYVEALMEAEGRS